MDVITRTKHTTKVNVNFDILWILLHTISRRPDLLAFMKTCKVFYRAGLPLLLGFPITLVLDGIRELHDDQLAAKLDLFCQYMLADVSRFIHIKDFRLSIHSTFSSEMRPLLRRVIDLVFQHSKKLDNLQFIESSASSWVYRVDFLPNKSSFESLQQLDIHFMNHNTAEMLKGLSAPLKSISLSFTDSLFNPIDTHPLHYLDSFSSTLESVAVTGGEFSRSSSRKFNSVRRLTLRDCKIPHSKVIVKTFPNVSNFSCFNSQPGTMFESKIIRHNNLMGLQSLHDHWTIESLHGDITAMYQFGLSGQVERVYAHSLDSTNVGLCRELLDEMRPKNLTIGITDPQNVFILKASEELFSYEGLTGLHVSLDFRSGYVTPTDRRVFKKFINSLRPASLTYLRVSITRTGNNCHICQRYGDEADDEYLYQMNELYGLKAQHTRDDSGVTKWLTSLNIRQFFSDMIPAVPTLRSVVIDTGAGLVHSICG
ncbi:hypothetical protein C8Q75DRAFT_730437 [Abortiporus biennis]|nr:hypothetical protein C8Q75DRAFT_730437 [Abortiporus biennis]